MQPIHIMANEVSQYAEELCSKYTAFVNGAGIFNKEVMESSSKLCKVAEALQHEVYNIPTSQEYIDFFQDKEFYPVACKLSGLILQTSRCSIKMNTRICRLIRIFTELSLLKSVSEEQGHGFPIIQLKQMIDMANGVLPFKAFKASYELDRASTAAGRMNDCVSWINDQEGHGFTVHGLIEKIFHQTDFSWNAQIFYFKNVLSNGIENSKQISTIPPFTDNPTWAFFITDFFAKTMKKIPPKSKLFQKLLDGKSNSLTKIANFQSNSSFLGASYHALQKLRGFIHIPEAQQPIYSMVFDLLFLEEYEYSAEIINIASTIFLEMWKSYPSLRVNTVEQFKKYEKKLDKIGWSRVKLLLQEIGDCSDNLDLRFYVAEYVIKIIKPAGGQNLHLRKIATEVLGHFASEGFDELIDRLIDDTEDPNITILAAKILLRFISESEKKPGEKQISWITPIHQIVQWLEEQKERVINQKRWYAPSKKQKYKELEAAKLQALTLKLEVITKFIAWVKGDTCASSSSSSSSSKE